MTRPLRSRVAKHRGLVERWPGEWSPTRPVCVCLWPGLMLGLPRGIVVESSGGQGVVTYLVSNCLPMAGVVVGLPRGTVAELGGGQVSGRRPGQRACAGGWGSRGGWWYWLLLGYSGQQWLGLAADPTVTRVIHCRDIPAKSAKMASLAKISRQ